MNTQQDITETLRYIIDRALVVLNADSIILFPYENHGFLSDPTLAGEFLHTDTESVLEIIEKNGWANLTLKSKLATIYLENQTDYFEFLTHTGAVESSNVSSNEDFWHRERVQSSVFLRLESGPQCLGVMFINYRTRQTFSPSKRQLVNDFAFLATTSIINDRLVSQAIDFGELQRRDSLSLSMSEIITSLAHNSGNLFYSLSVYFVALDQFVKKGRGKSIDRKAVKDLVDSMREPLSELAADFDRIQGYKKFNEFTEESCHIEELIDRALRILQPKLERNRISVKKSYALTPPIICDKNQIEHLLLNLFTNSLDAMGKRGTLSIGTAIHSSGDSIKIRITDTGLGIPPELHSNIFQPHFTTKLRGGTGLGLPVSRYIVEEHGGRIDFSSRPGKGTSFFIYLPVRK